MSFARYKKKQPCWSCFFVIPLGQNSNSLLEDLRQLNQLKDSPYHRDLVVNQHKQSLNTQSGVGWLLLDLFDTS